MSEEFPYSCKLKINLSREISAVILKAVSPEIGDIKKRGRVDITSTEPLEFKVSTKDLVSLRAAINSLIRWISLAIAIAQSEEL